MEKHDVVIVGAGYGGLRAAGKLAVKNKDVLILEKRTEDRIGHAPGILDFEFLLAPGQNIVPKSLYQSLTYPIFYWGEYKMALGEMFNRKVAIVRSSDIKHWLLKNTEKKGVEIRGESYVKKVVPKQNKVVLRDGKEIGYNHLIAADGPNSIVSKSLGLTLFNRMLGYCCILDERLNRNFEVIMDAQENEGWYWNGIIPFGKKQTLIGSGYANKSVKFPERRRTEERFLLKYRGIDLSEAKYKMILWSWSYNGFKHRKNIFMVGNSASFQNPTIGTAIYPAIKSGEAAAKAILGEDYKPDLKEALRYIKGGGQLFNLITRLGFSGGGGSNFNLDKTNATLFRFSKIFTKIGETRPGLTITGAMNRFLVKYLERVPITELILYESMIMNPAAFNSFEVWEKFINYTLDRYSSAMD